MIKLKVDLGNFLIEKKLIFNFLVDKKLVTNYIAINCSAPALKLKILEKN
jgi:hypothetical protein